MEGDNYTSQLIVPMKDELDGTTVECVYEDLLTNEESVIGQIHLTLTTGMYNMDAYINDVNYPLAY